MYIKLGIQTIQTAKICKLEKKNVTFNFLKSRKTNENDFNVK